MTKIYGQSSVVFSEDQLTHEIESLRAEVVTEIVAWLRDSEAVMDAVGRYLDEDCLDAAANEIERKCGRLEARILELLKENDELKEQLRRALLLADGVWRRRGFADDHPVVVDLGKRLKIMKAIARTSGVTCDT